MVQWNPWNSLDLVNIINFPKSGCNYYSTPPKKVSSVDVFVSGTIGPEEITLIIHKRYYLLWYF
jgi:hypothetical protein